MRPARVAFVLHYEFAFVRIGPVSPGRTHPLRDYGTRGTGHAPLLLC